ncbi:hypothetical protein A2U01_0070601, partial [Trifolium medium]|nr:hypothetical protein [Trifolium medium]
MQTLSVPYEDLIRTFKENLLLNVLRTVGDMERGPRVRESSRAGGGKRVGEHSIGWMVVGRGWLRGILRTNPSVSITMKGSSTLRSKS